MPALYIDRRDAHLDYASGQLRVHEPGERPKGFPLNGLERVVISGNVTIETRLLSHLAESGASVLVIEGRGARRYAHLHGYRHGDASRRLGQYQLCQDPAASLRWAKLVVRGRSQGALALLREAQALRPDLRNPLFHGIQTMAVLLPRIRAAASTASLRGLEGALSAAHFRAYTPAATQTAPPVATPNCST